MATRLLALRALLAVLALPGSVALLLPWVLVEGMGRRAMPILARAGGALLVAAGGLVLAWCVVDFARVGRGTLAPVDPPSVLVRRGLYRFVRNPMYVGVLTLVVGESLVWGSLAVALWAAVLALAFHVRVVRYEEPVLRATFGREFDDYSRAVPRWLPVRRRV